MTKQTIKNLEGKKVTGGRVNARNVDGDSIALDKLVLEVVSVTQADSKAYTVVFKAACGELITARVRNGIRFAVLEG